MKGKMAAFGDLVLDLAMKFFTFTLTAAGLDPTQVMAMLNKGVKVLTSIITSPMNFFSNLIATVGQGLKGFQANFKQHIMGGMLEWLTGAMGGAVEIPQSFGLKDMVRMGFSILGLTWSNLRVRLVKQVGEPVISAAEKGFELINIVREDGVAGLWEHIQQEAATIKDTVITGIKEWALTAIVKNAIIQIALMLNPAGAIVRAIVGIYDLVMWLIDNMERIISFVTSVVNSIASIAAGQIGAAAGFIEKAMANTIPMILSGLARLLRLGGIAKKIEKIVDKVREPIDKAVDKGIGVISKKAKSWFGKSDKGKERVNKKVVDEQAKKDEQDEKNSSKVKWWETEKAFDGDDGDSHKIYYHGTGRSAKLMVASKPQGVASFLRKAKQKINESKDGKIKKLSSNVTKSLALYKEIDALDSKLNSETKRDKKEALLSKLKSKFAHISQQLSALTVVFEQEEYPPAVLPPFTDGVKATGFTAEYISKKELDSGEISTKNGGTVIGWSELQDADLTTSGLRYVRMHLLSEKMGGKATDSNLVPAPGPTVNIPFATEIELPAYYSVKNGDNPRVWYKVTVSYHSGDQNAYPKRIASEYGTYTKENGKPKKVSVKSFSKSMDPPFNPVKFYINNSKKSGAEIAQALNIDTKLGKYIATVRGKYGSFKDRQAVINSLNTYRNENSRVSLSVLQVITINNALSANSDKVSYKRK